MNQKAIGIFDSGIGGLTCVKSLKTALPSERIIYLGDTARTPYGSKNINTIRNFSFQIADFLADMKVKIIIVACNTVSATCLYDLQERYPDIPIVGVIEPIAKRISKEEAPGTSIGILGTKATVNSSAYEKIIYKENSSLKLSSKACPAFVPLIEEGIIDNPIMDMTIHYYLDEFIEKNNIEKMVLGCTHFPWLTDNFNRLYPEIELLNPSAEVANAVREILDSKNALAPQKAKSDESPDHLCFVSDLSENVERMVASVFEGSESVQLSMRNFSDLSETKLWNRD